MGSLYDFCRTEMDTTSRKFLDAADRKNVEDASAAGLETRVIRSYDDVGLHGGKDDCEFCKSREGEWSYQDAISHGVFQRHPGCECEIDYKTQKGTWQRQANWKSNQWKDVSDYDTLKARKRQGLLQRIITPGERSVRAEFQLSAKEGGSTDGTIRRELGNIDVSRTAEAISYFQEEIRSYEVENAIVIDKKGNVVHFIGTPDGVGLFNVDLDGARILHNHPEINGIVSFGPDDFFIMRDHQNAVFDLCNAQYNYHLEIVKDISTLSYNEIYHWPQIDANTNEDIDIQHEVMKALAERGYIIYERKEK